MNDSDKSEPQAPTPAEMAQAGAPEFEDHAQRIPEDGETTLANAELQKLLDAAEEAKALREDVLRAKADFDNYRKRAQREKEDAVRATRESVIEQLLPIFDNFDMGMMAVEQNHDPKAIAQGMTMIHNQLKATMADLGVEEITVAPGAEFDHNIHDAVGTEPSDEHPEGHVTLQARKGYKVNGRLVRPASVKVAQAKE